MSLVNKNFEDAVNKCLELAAAIDTHHDPEQRAALSEQFVALYEQCDAFGKKVIAYTQSLAEQEGRSKEYIKGCKDVIEAYLKQMGTLRSTQKQYQSAKNLTTKNAVKSTRAREDEEEIKRAA